MKILEYKYLRQFLYLGQYLYIPLYINYLTINKNGFVIGHVSLPRIYKNYWTSSDLQVPIAMVDLEGIDWRETMVEIING